MEHEPDRPGRNKGRETILTLSLVAILGGAFIFFLNLISLGIFFWVIVVMIGIAGVGFLHYVVWGHALSQQVAGEREEQRIKELLEKESAEEYRHHVKRKDRKIDKTEGYL